LIVVVLLAIGARGPTQDSPASTSRSWPEALLAAEHQPDDLARSRARVEVLYAAGDLPGALQAALVGLKNHAEDLVLLRRACQLALALRIADIAESHATLLAAAVVRVAPDGATGDWWKKESLALSGEARGLAARERELRNAEARARFASLALLGTVLAAMVGLGRAR
jgi:hypothetical protein